MRKVAVYFISLLLLSSCATQTGDIHQTSSMKSPYMTEAATDEDLVSQIDLTRANVFVGFTDVIPNTKIMGVNALLNSAKQDLLNDYIVVGSRDFTQKAEELIGYDFYRKGEVVGYNNDEIAQKIEQLEVVEKRYNSRNGVVVVVQDPYKSDDIIYTIHEDSENVPLWLDEIPVIEGYYVGSGKSNGEYTIASQIESATYDAFINMYTSKGFSNDMIISDNYGDSDYLTTESFIASVGVVKGFKAIDYYYDKKSRTYYCLGVIKKN